MDKRPIATKVIKNSLWNSVRILFAKGGGIIFAALLARFLLPEKFGIYSLTISITLFLLTFIDVGINETLIRFFSEQFKKERKKAISRYKYIFKIKLIFSFTFSFLLLILAYPLSVFFNKPGIFLPLMISSLYLLVFSISSFYESFFYIFENVKYLSYKRILWEFLRIVGVVFVFLFISKEIFIEGTISVLILATLFVFLYVLFSLKKIYPFLFSSGTSPLERKDKIRINKFLGYMATITALGLIFGSIDIMMIGFFLPAEFVGFYSAALTLVIGLSQFLSISNILLPIFTRLEISKSKKTLEKIFRYIYLISLPSIFGIFVVGNYIIRTIYGLEYLSSTYPLYILSLLVLETPIINTLKSYFSAKEKLSSLTLILVISTFVNIILNFVLITFLMKTSFVWAITGVSVATVASRTIYLVGLIFLSKKKMDISLNLKKFLKPLIASLVMFFTLYLFNKLIVDMTLFLGILEIIMGISVYLLMILILNGIEKEDFILIKHFFNIKN